MPNHSKTNSTPKLQMFTIVVAKISEICAWCATLAMVAIFILNICQSSHIAELFNSINQDHNLSCLGFSISSSELNDGLIASFSIVSVILCSLMAMIFRNTYLILRTSINKTWFSKGNTPFQKDIIRMVREIGIFLITSTVISLIATVVLHIIFPSADFSCNLTQLVLGLLMLCLSQSFTYGLKLEKDVSGLI